MLHFSYYSDNIQEKKQVFPMLLTNFISFVFIFFITVSLWSKHKRILKFFFFFFEGHCRIIVFFIHMLKMH